MVVSDCLSYLWLHSHALNSWICDLTQITHWSAIIRWIRHKRNKICLVRKAFTLCCFSGSHFSSFIYLVHSFLLTLQNKWVAAKNSLRVQVEYLNAFLLVSVCTFCLKFSHYLSPPPPKHTHTRPTASSSSYTQCTGIWELCQRALHYQIILLWVRPLTRQSQTNHRPPACPSLNCTCTVCMCLVPHLVITSPCCHDSRAGWSDSAVGWSVSCSEPAHFLHIAEVSQNSAGKDSSHVKSGCRHGEKCDLDGDTWAHKSTIQIKTRDGRLSTSLSTALCVVWVTLVMIGRSLLLDTYLRRTYSVYCTDRYLVNRIEIFIVHIVEMFLYSLNYINCTIPRCLKLRYWCKIIV